MSIKRIEGDGYTLLVMIPDVGLECRVTFLPRDGDGLPTPETLRAHLGEAGVVAGIDDQAIEEFCSSIAAGACQEATIVAHGTPSVPGTDGCLDFPGDAVAANLDDQESATIVDLHRVQGLRTIVAGEVAARILPPHEGLPGISVTGDPIPPPEVRPLQLKLGDGVILAPAGDEVLATRTGRIVYLDRTLSISEEYLIKGNVDFKVGHVSFPGVVIVTGDILDDFHVTATRGLIVNGIVGACSIASDGDIQLGGMAGQMRGTIRCGGNLSARYLDEIDAEVGGTVYVENEIVNATIRVGGAVSCGGHIAGGTCIAKGGIEAKVLGSPAGHATRLVAGIDWQNLEQLTLLFRRIAEIAGHSERTSDRQQLEELHAERKRLQREVIALKTLRDDRANAKINVRTKIEDQVIITLGDTTQTLADLVGPVSIIENPSTGNLMSLALTPLAVTAAQLLAAGAGQ